MAKNSKIEFYKNGYNGTIKVSKNQKVIQAHRIDKGVNFEASYKAMEKLTSDGYLLYMYLVMHPLNKVWALSSKDVTSRTPLSMRTYNSAVHELIEKGYLVQANIDIKELHFSENAYHLLEDPERFEIKTDENGVVSVELRKEEE
jgi:hypothetical protein